ncbi:amidohydrolase family protein [Pararobbsia alpina]|uniref:Isoxanthopterin deaminase n=1 Tax=Pararobbsia alpina TaxID=621374 RepID=A0A6S7BHC7_9BURK|nr:amidohydrolase family protein [Pararobbsia alpina]CAB3791180.1 Isoxanthopterin deaminase [Pararobbsia alpina]
MDNSFLIRNAQALMTGLPGAAARHAGPSLRVVNGRIDAIGTLEALPGEEVIDAQGCVVYPAWVNTHHHLFQSMIKGDPHGINCSLGDWLEATPYRLRPAFDEATFRLAARTGLLELALSGCGTVADHNYLYGPGMTFDPSAVLFEEAARVGVRLVLCRAGATRTTRYENEHASVPAESLEQIFTDIQRLKHLYHEDGDNAMRRVAVATTIPFHALHPHEFRDMARFARSEGLRMHTHLNETIADREFSQDLHGMSPVAFAEKHEWMGPDVWFAHMVKPDADEIATLGASQTGIAHCAQSNGRLGSGIAPIPALARAGARISLGVDGAASNEAADMASETHFCWLVHRAGRGSQTMAGALGGKADGNTDGGADAVTIEDIVHWGTSGGAQVLGLPAVGSLECGKAADIAIYKLDHPRYFGLLDPAIGPVASGGTPNLRALFVNGRKVVENGKHVGIDTEQLRADAIEVAHRMRAFSAN